MGRLLIVTKFEFCRACDNLPRCDLELLQSDVAFRSREARILDGIR